MPRQPPDAIDRQLGAGLRRLRRERGLTQQALGDVLGVTGQQIVKYERAHDRLAASKLITLSRALGVTVDQFLQGEMVD